MDKLIKTLDEAIGRLYLIKLKKTTDRNFKVNKVVKNSWPWISGFRYELIIDDEQIEYFQTIEELNWYIEEVLL